MENRETKLPHLDPYIIIEIKINNIFFFFKVNLQIFLIVQIQNRIFVLYVKLLQDIELNAELSIGFSSIYIENCILEKQ